MKLDLSEVYWLHDDWFLYFKYGDFVVSYCTDEDPLWWPHDPTLNDCEEGCARCAAIWVELCDKNVGDALVAFGLGVDLKPYVPDDWCEAVWNPVFPYLRRLREAREARKAKK